MKNARMNISHSRFILSKLKIFGEIVTTYLKFILFSICQLFAVQEYQIGKKNQKVMMTDSK